MRICSPQLGLSPNSVLGGEVYDREILLGLAKKNVKIDIIIPNKLEYNKNVKNWFVTELPVRRIPAILFNLIVIPYLFLIYNRTKFQIIRLHSPQFIGFGVLLFKIFVPKIKIIATFHQFREAKIFGLGKILNHKWDHIITDSDYVRSKIIKEFSADKGKITAIHNGTPGYLKPSDKNNKLQKDLKLNGKIVLLFVGLFIKRKNPLFLIDVLSKLTQTRSDLVLIFLGKGPLKPKIIKRARELNLSNKIRILDPIYGSEKTKIHNLADIFVHPAQDEGFPLVPLESMACSKPIVMNDAYSAREIIDDGINGFICKINNLDDWSNKIENLIKNPKARIKMGKNSLKKVHNEFSWETSIKKHLEVLKSLNNTGILES